MMSRVGKKTMAWERHVETGNQLRRAQDYLSTLTVDLGNTYSSSSKVTRLAEKAFLALSALRCELDRLLFEEHDPRDGVDRASAYYGNAGR